MPRNTFCGTLEYMSPEMIQNGSHNHTLDIWCLGILLYELLHGHAPFRGNSYSAISERILKGKIRFKKGLPDDVRNLIISLLQREANDRIPLIKVFSHPWVKRLEKKHKLSKQSRSSKHSKQSIPIEEEKQLFDKQMEEDSKVINMASGEKAAKYIDPPARDDDIPDEPHMSFHKDNSKKKPHKEENKYEVSPSELEAELNKIEQMETQKRRMMHAPIVDPSQKSHSKYENLLRKSPRKEEKTILQENHNLLDLSQFDNQNKSNIGFSPKFEKLEKIPSKNKVKEERESSLPKHDDFHEDNKEFGLQKKQIKQESKLNQDYLHDIDNELKELEADLHDLNESTNEHEVLNAFKENVKDTSFILNNNQSKKKKKDEMMDLINDIDDELDKIEIDDLPRRPRNKSVLLSKSDAEQLLVKPPKKFEAGEKIVNAINKFDDVDKYNVDNYDELVKSAEAKLLGEHDSDSSIKYKKKELPIEINNKAKDRISDSLIGLNEPDEDDEDNKNADNIEFLKVSKSYIDDESEQNPQFKFNKHDKNKEDDPFSKDREYENLDNNKDFKFLKPVHSKTIESENLDTMKRIQKSPKTEIYTDKNIDKIESPKKNEIPYNSNFGSAVKEADLPSLIIRNKDNPLKFESPSKGKDLVKLQKESLKNKKNAIKFLQENSSEHDSSDHDDEIENDYQNSKFDQKSNPSPEFLGKQQEVVQPYQNQGNKKSSGKAQRDSIDSEDSGRTSQSSLFVQDKEKQRERILRFSKGPKLIKEEAKGKNPNLNEYDPQQKKGKNQLYTIY